MKKFIKIILLTSLNREEWLFCKLITPKLYKISRRLQNNSTQNNRCLLLSELVNTLDLYLGGPLPWPKAWLRDRKKNNLKN